MDQQPGNPAWLGDKHPALWCASSPTGESAALVRFLTPVEGALLLKAPGLLKSGSKLAPLLQYGDELQISLARGRSRTPTLTGVSLERPHSLWRRGLRPLALLWLMLESAALSSSAPAANAAAYQLVVNLLRSEPDDDALTGALCVFCLKLLALHGLALDLLNCAESGVPFAEAEPVFLLPSGEGLVHPEVVYASPTRTSGALVRIDPPRRRRWVALVHGPLLRYGERGCDAQDAGLLLGILARQIGSLSNLELASARHLAQVWRLAPTPQAPA